MIRFVNDTARLAFTQNSLRNAVSLWRTSRDPKLRENCFLSAKQSKSFATQLSPTVNPQSDLLKDVIVYKYDNPRFFKLMNIFAVSQFLFWGEFFILIALTWTRQYLQSKSRLSKSDLCYFQGILVIGRTQVSATQKSQKKWRRTKSCPGGEKLISAKTNTELRLEHSASLLVRWCEFLSNSNQVWLLWL